MTVWWMLNGTICKVEWRRTTTKGFLPKMIDIENNIKIRISEIQTCCFYLSTFLLPSLSIYQSSGINNRRTLCYSTMKCVESCLTVSYFHLISRYCHLAISNNFYSISSLLRFFYSVSIHFCCPLIYCYHPKYGGKKWTVGDMTEIEKETKK